MYTLTATDLTTGTYVKEEAETFAGRMVDGGKQLLLPDENKALTDKEGFAGMVGISALVMIGSSMYTRKRVNEGKAPIARVIF